MFSSAPQSWPGSKVFVPEKPEREGVNLVPILARLAKVLAVGGDDRGSGDAVTVVLGGHPPPVRQTFEFVLAPLATVVSQRPIATLSYLSCRGIPTHVARAGFT